MKKIIIIILLFVCKDSFSQRYFEGEIVYKTEATKKDSSFNLEDISTYPSKRIFFYFKDGHWMQKPEAGYIEYEYFDRVLNTTFYKLQGGDTLYFTPYDKRTPEQDSIISLQVQTGTDTILGRKCDRLLLTTARWKLTFIFSPTLEINPDWFAKTPGGYYDIIYSHTKSLYIGLIVETDQYIIRDVAEK